MAADCQNTAFTNRIRWRAGKHIQISENTTIIIPLSAKDLNFNFPFSHIPPCCMEHQAKPP
jgi:hypothetical protein